MTYFRLYHMAAVVWLMTGMAGVVMGTDFNLLNAAYSRVQSMQVDSGTNFYANLSNAELATKTVHANGPSSEYLAERSNFIIDFLNFFNAKTVQNMTFTNFQQLVQELETKREQVCPNVDLECQDFSLKYRTINGVCNNLKNYRWGSSKTAQRRSVPAAWESGAIVNVPLAAAPDGPSVSLDPIGVPQQFPMILHIPANTQTQIWFLKGTLTNFKIMCVALFCQVDGQIKSLSSAKRNCKYGRDFWFSGNRIFTTKKCKDLEGQAQQIAANVTLNTQNIAESYIGVDGTKVTANANVAPSASELYWIDRKGDNLIVGHGSECDTRTELMRAKVSLDDVSPEMVAMAAISLAGDTSIGFPIRGDLRLETSEDDVPANTIKTLDAVPFTYADGSLIIGVKAFEGSVLEVILQGGDGNVTVIFGDAALIKTTYDTSTTTLNNFTSSEIPFLDSNGEPTDFSAYWISWLGNRIYTGRGNIIGKNSYLPIHDFNAGLPSRTFAAKRVLLRSYVSATWRFTTLRRNVPRETSVTGRKLPTARDVSLCAHSGIGQETAWSKVLTMAVFQFGQFVDHDIIATPTEHHTEHCCHENQLSTTPDRFCFPIKITDKFPSKQDTLPFPANECLDFFRSAAIIDCDSDDMRTRENMNLITSFVDASNVYGSEKEISLELRAVDADGNPTAYMKLKDNELPVPSTVAEGEGGACFPTVTEHKCRFAGDFRSQEQPLLAATHTVFVREHNRLVDGLKGEGWPSGNVEENEVLYQEARRIVIAEMQVITYDGYLASFMDDKIMGEYKIRLEDSCTYDANLDPRISISMGIAYRMGHTWIPDLIDALNGKLLKDNFFNPDVSYTDGSDSIMHNLGSHCPHTDRFLEKSVLSTLFGKGDLAALNIQRGRDEGAGTFCDLYEHFMKTDCPATFQEMVQSNIITQEVANLLKECYDCVADIDLFTGVLIQTPMVEVPGSSSKSTIGELLNHIMADFFKRVKCGDRYWFENTAAGFTSKQIKELKRASLSRIMCDNTDIKEIQPDLFLVETVNGNKKRPCTAQGKIRKLRLNRFRNRDSKRELDEDEIAREKVEDELERMEDLLDEISDLDDLADI